MENRLATYGSWVTVIEGAIFVFCVLVFRRGVVGEILALARRLASRGRSAASGRSPSAV